MRFLENGENVVFLGPPGVGKTHLASALGLVAAVSQARRVNSICCITQGGSRPRSQKITAS